MSSNESVQLSILHNLSKKNDDWGETVGGSVA